MASVIEERAARLASVVPGADGMPLLRWMPVDVIHLRKLTEDYISFVGGGANSGNGRVSPHGSDQVEALRPLANALADIARTMPGIDAIEDLPNVRIYDGRANYAIQRFHVDMWTGEPADTIVCMVPLSGDVEKCGVRFTEPVNPDPARYTTQYGEYGAGLEANSGYTEYPVRMRLGMAYVMDSYCLHQSMKGEGVRTSIDFRLRYRDKVPSDAMKNPRTGKYVLL